MSTTTIPLRERLVRPAVVVLGLAGVAAVGLNVPGRPLVAGLLATAILVFGLTLVDALLLPLLAMPFMVIIVRMGMGSLSLALSDLVLGLVLVPAVLFGRRPYSRPMSWMLILTACYQFATLFAVAAHPFSASIVEWLHAGVLVGGSLLVGWALGRDGRGPLAVRLFVLGVLVILAGTFYTAAVHFARRDFGPVFTEWPFLMHKNLVGPVLVLAATVAYVRPAWLGWGVRSSRVLFTLCVVGALLTQSRQAFIGMSVVLVLFVIRSPARQRRNRGILVVVVGLVGVSLTMLQDQLESGNRFNSAQTRLSWFSDGVDAWLRDPWVGLGLRWWYAPENAGAIQPPNAEFEQLTSTGVIGLVGFVVLFVGALMVLARTDPAYALMPMMVLICRLVQSQFDLFWVAVMGSVPWLLVGLALGAQAHAEAAARPGPLQLATARAAPLVDRPRPL